MTTKDYVEIAFNVRQVRPVSDDLTNDGVRAAHHALDMFAHNFADRAAGDNPHFDRAKFLAACEAPENRFDR